MNIYYRVRAFLLHHYLPSDKSIFGKVKDPVYCAISIFILLPVHLVRVLFFVFILVFLIFPGPPDEFQLINYILLFKGSQFLSAGIFSMGLGAVQYFLCFCTHKEDLLNCISSAGPGGGEAVIPGLQDYLGSVILPWIAFSALPYSRRYVKRTFVGRVSGEPPIDEEEEAAETVKYCCFECRVVKTKGGRLRHLLRYDVKCFIFSLLVLLLLTGWTWSRELEHTKQHGFYAWLRDSPQFKEDFFWCKVLYGLLSLPFLPFMIPLLLQILTHCEFTGYNEKGACVEFIYPNRYEEPEVRAESSDGSLPGSSGAPTRRAR